MMKCRVCGNEMNGFCENCGWEEENILDESYLEIYNKKFQIIKSNYEELHSLKTQSSIDEFLDKLIEKFNPLIHQKRFNELNLFLDLVLDLIKESSKYQDFLVAKIYTLIQLSQIDEAKHYFNELENLKSTLSSENLEYLENFKRVLNV